MLLAYFYSCPRLRLRLRLRQRHPPARIAPHRTAPATKPRYPRRTLHPTRWPCDLLLCSFFSSFARHSLAPAKGGIRWRDREPGTREGPSEKSGADTHPAALCLFPLPFFIIFFRTAFRPATLVYLFFHTLALTLQRHGYLLSTTTTTTAITATASLAHKGSASRVHWVLDRLPDLAGFSHSYSHSGPSPSILLFRSFWNSHLGALEPATTACERPSGPRCPCLFFRLPSLAPQRPKAHPLGFISPRVSL